MRIILRIWTFRDSIFLSLILIFFFLVVKFIIGASSISILAWLILWDLNAGTWCACLLRWSSSSCSTLPSYNTCVNHHGLIIASRAIRSISIIINNWVSFLWWWWLLIQILILGLFSVLNSDLIRIREFLLIFLILNCWGIELLILAHEW